MGRRWIYYGKIDIIMTWHEPVQESKTDLGRLGTYSGRRRTNAEVSNVRCHVTILECTGTDWWIVACWERGWYKIFRA
jgi:hypothetical protein